MVLDEAVRRGAVQRIRARLAAQPGSAWWVSMGTLAAYTLLSTLQWRRYESPSWDLGIFTQVVQQYARLQAPIVHIKGADYNILGDHFHPLLVVLAPIYALLPTAYILLVLQALLVAISAFFVAKTAHEHLGAAAGWLIGIAYALCWGVQQAVAVQFHEVALGAPILAISLWAMLRKSWWTAAIWGGLLVFVKEDLGLTVLALGLVLAWRSKNWLLGGGLAAWGLSMFALTTKVFLPALNPKSQYDYDKYLDPGQVLADPFGNLAEILTNDKKMATVLLLLACTGFFLLRSSLGWLVLPTLAWRFLSNNEGHWGQTWHYSLMLMPIAYAAAVDGIARLRTSRVPWLKAYARHGAVVVLTFAVAISNQLPLFELRDPQKWITGNRQASAERVLELVPPEVTVGSDVSLMAYLVSRRDVYYIGQEGNPVEDYLVIDNVGGGWSSQVDVTDYAVQIHPGTSWEKIFDENGYQVVRRTN